MAISIKKSSTAVKETVTSSLPKEIQSQISNNLKLDTTDYTALPSEKPAQAEVVQALKQTVTPEEPKGKRSDDVVQLKFSKGKRAEAKAFYSSYDVKMNAGFEMAYEFLKEEVMAGRVRLSKSGIQRIN
ncbi:MAG: hypothetical protein K6E78_04855 [Treponema sp.]|nr:hypothetical protein [Treponema sp.]